MVHKPVKCHESSFLILSTVPLLLGVLTFFKQKSVWGGSAAYPNRTPLASLSSNRSGSSCEARPTSRSAARGPTQVETARAVLQKPHVRTCRGPPGANICKTGRRARGVPRKTSADDNRSSSAFKHLRTLEELPRNDSYKNTRASPLSSHYGKAGGSKASSPSSGFPNNLTLKNCMSV